MLARGSAYMSGKRIRTSGSDASRVAAANISSSDGSRSSSSSSSGGGGRDIVADPIPSSTSVTRNLAVGIRRLPSAIFGCVLQYAGSCDLGALAAVSRQCREFVVGFIRTAKTITLDVCYGEMFGHGRGNADALRGCAVRGIRLVQAHLAAAHHIRYEWGTVVRGASIDNINRSGTSDAKHIESAVTAMVVRSRDTLQSLGVGIWCDCKALMTALSDCRHLTSLVLPSAKLDSERWIRGAMHTLVASNAGRLSTLVAHHMTADSLAVALRRLPLTRLQIQLAVRIDRTLLAGCTTLESLSLEDYMCEHGSKFPAACAAIAHAAPNLTRLQKLHIKSIECFDPGELAPWRFAPSLASVRLCACDDNMVPEMLGGSVTSLSLEKCEDRLDQRLVRWCHATLTTLDLCDSNYRPKMFIDDLLGPLATCSRLESLMVDGDKDMAASASTLVALTRACPNLTALHLPVRSSVRARHLAALLEATQERLRDLRLYYPNSKQTKARRRDPSRTAKEDGKGDPTRQPLLYLPHLVLLKVDMCNSELLQRVRCQRLETLDLAGVRVRLRGVPEPASFPRLECLQMGALSAAARIPGHPPDLRRVHKRLSRLILRCDCDGLAKTDVVASFGATLGCLIDCCPQLAELVFRGGRRRTPYERWVAALGLAEDQSSAPSEWLISALAAAKKSRHPSRLRKLVLPKKLAVSSDELLRDIVSIRARPPQLASIDVACADTVEPRIVDALYNS